MKARSLILVVLTMSLLGLWQSPVGTDSTISYQEVGGASASAVSQGKAVAVVEKSGKHLVVKHLVASSAQDANTLVNEKRQQSGVVAVSLDTVVKAFYTPTGAAPNDTYYSAYQYNLQQLNAPSVWQTATGNGITVAVVDTGVDATHEDLAGQVLAGTDLLSGGNGETDPNGHGTFVAGVIAAVANNGKGIAGLAPNAKILPVRVLDSTGTGYGSDIANGIIWATDHGAQVINLSLGGSSYDSVEASAVTYAESHGVVITAAAGNYGDTTNPVEYPCAYSGVLCVGAIDSTGTVASFSEHNSYVSLVAPGVSIASLGPGNAYKLGDGTSFSSPHVAAAAAILEEACSSWSASNVSTALFAGTDAAGDSNYYGHGKLDIARSLPGSGVSGVPSCSSAPTTTTTSTTNPTTTSTTSPTTTTSTTVVSGTPTASFTYSSAPYVNSFTLSVNGSASTTPIGSITSYAWDFGDGFTGSGSFTSHTYATTGTYTVTLTVTNTSGKTASSSQVVSYYEAPTASFTLSPNTGNAPLAVSMDGSASTVDKGSISSYAWDFGDGVLGSGPIVSHTYTAAGTYNVVLNVTDSHGATARSTQSVQVTGSSGLWSVAKDGGVFSFGGAAFYGSTGNIKLNQPVVGMASTSDGQGYWFVASDGGIFSYGDANFYGSTGSIKLNQPIVGMAPTPDGKGYWLVASDGGIFSFGDAAFYGSTGNIKLNQPIVGMAPTASGHGYYLVASDGGVFAFGDAAFYGSTGGIQLNQPIVGMAQTLTGRGYWMVAKDGGIFSFGDATFYGSSAVSGKTFAGMLPYSAGYVLLETDGALLSYGNAASESGLGSNTASLSLNAPIVGGARR